MSSIAADWTTAVGTLLVAAAAVGIAIWSERRVARRTLEERERTDNRLNEERNLADKRLAEERDLTEIRLKQDRDLTERRLKEERDLTEGRLREERERAQEAEQLSDAWSVEIFAGFVGPERGIDTESGQPIARPVVVVVNRSGYTITRVDAKFSIDGVSVSEAQMEETFQDSARLPQPLVSDVTGSIGQAYRGVLPPGTAVRFIGDTRLVRDLRSAYPIVRWADRRGSHWEHKRGTVQPVAEQDPWLA